MESIYFLIALFLILIVSVPITFKVKAVVDLEKQDLNLCLYFLKLKVKKFKLVFKNNKFFARSKNKDIEIVFSQKQAIFVEEFSKSVIDKIFFKQVYVSTKIGVSTADKTANICGAYLAMLKIFACYVKTKKPSAKIEIDVAPIFNKSMFVGCFYFKLSISIFDILYSLIFSVFGLRRRLYETARQVK